MCATEPPEPNERFFADVYWLHTVIPVAALHGHRILLSMQDGEFVREAVFRLDARAHERFPDIQLIYAFHDSWNSLSATGTTTRITFDQHRADQIQPAISDSGEYEFTASFDLRRPLQRVPELDDRIETYIEEVLRSFPVLIQDPIEYRL
jgi:hypothetical protein